MNRRVRPQGRLIAKSSRTIHAQQADQSHDNGRIWLA
jgi:hypothetical protein